MPKSPEIRTPPERRAANAARPSPAKAIPALVMSVKRSTWRMHDENKEAANAAYARVRMDVLRRDAFTCRYCGFTPQGDPQAHPSSRTASGYLEVHHLDDNHHNNRPANLLTVCPFCHQVFHTGNAGHRQAARIAWCPWLTQAEVVLLSNIAAVAIARQGRFASAGQAWFRWLEQMQTQAAQVYGDAILDVTNLGMALMACGTSASPGWIKRAQALAPLRLVPRRDAYQAAIAWWSEHAWRAETQWDAVLGEWERACQG